MQIKISVEPINENRPQSEHVAVRVSTLTLRGDTWTTQKVDNVLCDGKDVVFTVPDGAQLHLATPLATEEIVYDAAQGASIRKSQQANDDGRADRASEKVGPGITSETNLERAKREEAAADAARSAREKETALIGSQGGDSRSPDQKLTGQPLHVPPGTRVTNPSAVGGPLPGSQGGSSPSGDVGKDK